MLKHGPRMTQSPRVGRLDFSLTKHFSTGIMDSAAGLAIFARANWFANSSQRRRTSAAHLNQERGMAAFAGVDFIDFDSQLNDEEKLVRQTARQFVENEVIPIIEKHSREGTFPHHLVPQLGELGFFGASLHGYGCAGMSNVAYGLVTQELERGDSGLRSFVSVQCALVMYPIYTYGSDAQKDKWLPLLAQGKAIGCFGLTEPQFGSNPGGMLTRAVKKGDKYVLNGEKMWITSGSIADVAVVWAKCEDEKIRGFLVEKGTPGFKAWDVHGKWSLRASVTSGLAFTDCEIPEANLLPASSA